MTEGWGSIAWGVRLEKMVESKFVEKWSHLLWKMATEYGRPGDGFLIARDKVAHENANDLAHKFLETDCDSLLFIDSDADFGPRIIEELRTFEPGFEFDALQAFYTRRGWPPEAIWYTEDALGRLSQNWILGELTQEVAQVGTHFLIVRREVFEKMLETRDPDMAREDFDFFYYPRHERISEDAAFSREARALGFRLGATTGIKVGHISRVTTGWETYQAFLEISGQKRRLHRYEENIRLVSEYLGEDPSLVAAKANLGSANVKEGLEDYLRQVGEYELGDLEAKQAREFYGDLFSGYFYELILWNSSVLYDLVYEILETEIVGKSVLVVGGGIGGEVEALREKNGVVVFELPGALREFLTERYADDDRVAIYTEPSDLREIAAPPEELRYDLVVAVDTVEHFHPSDFEGTLDKMLELTKPGGYLFFRNNFEDFAKYPMHFDHAAAFAEWLETNELDLDAEYGRIGVEVYRKRGAINAED